MKRPLIVHLKNIFTEKKGKSTSNIKYNMAQNCKLMQIWAKSFKHRKEHLAY